MNDYNFGNFVCNLRERKGLTQADIAARLGVTPAAVSKWENGSSKPRVEVLFALAQILEVRPEELMAGHPLPEETLDPEAIRRINERYEYLRKIDSHNSIGNKIRRLVAWVIDWNLIGGIVLILAEVVMTLLKGQMQSNPSLALILLLTILSYPLCFVLRDFIMGGRSLGKRIMGLVILDKRTGDPAKLSQCCLRNLFLFILQIDTVVMLASGSTLGDRVAHTVVISKRDMTSSAETVAEDATIEKINNYKSPSPMSAKKIVLLICSIVAAFLLFLGVILLIVHTALSAVKETVQYDIAYTYLTQSQAFKELNIEEDKIKFNSYRSSSTTDENGDLYTTAEFGFRIGLRQLQVICHRENDVWYVCTDCTHLE